MHGSKSPAVSSFQFFSCFLMFFVHIDHIVLNTTVDSVVSLQIPCSRGKRHPSWRCIALFLTDRTNYRCPSQVVQVSWRSLREQCQQLLLVEFDPPLRQQRQLRTWLGSVRSSHGATAATGSEFWGFDGWDSLEVSFFGDPLVFDHFTMTLRGIADNRRCRSA